MLNICYAVHAMQAGVLLGLQQPMLFVNGDADGQCPTGLLAQLVLSDQASCKDARLVVLPVSGWPVTTSIILHKLRRLAVFAVETARGRPPPLSTPSTACPPACSVWTCEPPQPRVAACQRQCCSR